MDGLDCWVIGQSIKDAAEKKPTYLLPRPPDAARFKKTEYDAIWAAATVLL
ncbi:MAG: hypothetical protein K2X82_06110 [Gemmataceae bacterium]|nr:hypothetical protein [Gemmataceae bacterium]